MAAGKEDKTITKGYVCAQFLCAFPVIDWSALPLSSGITMVKSGSGDKHRWRAQVRGATHQPAHCMHMTYDEVLTTSLVDVLKSRFPIKAEHGPLGTMIQRRQLQ
jgi:hypothetical protein